MAAPERSTVGTAVRLGRPARFVSAGVLSGVAALTLATTASAIPELRAPSGGYPDGRAPELISPVDKNGGNARTMYPAPNGDGVLFLQSTANSENSNAANQEIPIVARRTASGWALTDMTTKALDVRGTWARTRDIDPSLRTMVIQSNSILTPGDDDLLSDYDLFSLDGVTRTVRMLSKEQGVPNPQSTRASEYVGASRDRSVVVFSRLTDEQNPLLPGDNQRTNNLYRERGGSLERVSILPDGTTAGLSSGEVSAPLWTNNGLTTQTGSDAPVGGGRTHNVSDDGSRVFFYYGADSSSLGLYLRDGDRTVAVSAAEDADPADPLAPARFVGASHDGAVSFFESSQALTPGASGGGLYRFDVDAPAGQRLTRVSGPSSATVSSAWTSDDASSVYFVSPEALNGEAAADVGASSGRAYVWRDGDLEYIGDVGSDGAVARVTPDGSHALFSSTASVGGAQTGGRQALYLFTAETEQIACASCRNDGTANEGDAQLTYGSPDFVVKLTNARGLTDDGRVFFTSTDRLVAGDSGDAADVYEFDGDAVKLLTPGGGTPSYVLDNTDDGGTVFVTTPGRLAAQDIDAGAWDIYALRVGGGFPVTAPPPACSGDGCQAAPQPLPGPLTPGSTAPGNGNVAPPSPRPEVTPKLAGRPTITRASTKNLAASGRGRVTLSVSGEAKLDLTATARVRGRTRVVATSKASTSGAGRHRVAFTVRLSKAARAELTQKRRLRVRIVVKMRGANKHVSRTLTLRKASR